jgi:hypothetical protein
MYRILIVGITLVVPAFFYFSTSAPSENSMGLDPPIAGVMPPASPDALLTEDDVFPDLVVQRDEGIPRSAVERDTTQVKPVSVGEYIDPDRGADFSNRTETIEIGTYIDPDRDADFSTPVRAIEVGDYIDPDRGAVLVVDPLTQVSIGVFIDPDALFSDSSDADVEIGAPMDPDWQ